MGEAGADRLTLRVLDKEGREVAVVPLDGDGEFGIGRDAGSCTVVLPDPSVSRRHGLIRRAGAVLEVRDLGSTNGIRVGRIPAREGWNTWVPGRKLHVGIYAIEVVRPEDGDDGGPTGPSPVGGSAPAPAAAFPDGDFGEAIVDPARLAATGRKIEEVDVVSVGGGAASFALVDWLRIRGLSASRVKVLTLADHPLARILGIAHALGLRDDDRLRAPSHATPDNPWGTPGFAAREAAGAVRALKPGEVLPPLAAAFVGSSLVDPYGPPLGMLRDGVEREAARIGWADMTVPGRALALRKTRDGRFALAYRVGADKAEGDDRNRFLIARHVHIATGWPAVEYGPVMSRFRRQYRASQRAAAAREPHEPLFAGLLKRGGVIAILGAGHDAFVSVARALQIRQRQRQAVIVQVGPDFDLRDDDWPQSAYRLPDGSQRAVAGSGPSAPERDDVLALIEAGLADGWFRQIRGAVTGLVLSGETITVTVGNGGETLSFAADFVVDAEEIAPQALDQPLLRDLVDTYGVPVAGGGLVVSERFGLDALANGEGRVHVSGLPASGGPFAPADSFLGHRIAALTIAEDLAPTLHLPRFGPLRSAGQWLRRMRGATP